MWSGSCGTSELCACMTPTDPKLVALRMAPGLAPLAPIPLAWPSPPAAAPGLPAAGLVASAAAIAAPGRPCRRERPCGGCGWGRVRLVDALSPLLLAPSKSWATAVLDRPPSLRLTLSTATGLPVTGSVCTASALLHALVAAVSTGVPIAVQVPGGHCPGRSPRPAGDTAAMRGTTKRAPLATSCCRYSHRGGATAGVAGMTTEARGLPRMTSRE